MATASVGNAALATIDMFVAVTIGTVIEGNEGFARWCVAHLVGAAQNALNLALFHADLQFGPFAARWNVAENFAFKGAIL